MTQEICIQNIYDYNREVKNGNLILTPKKIYLSETELYNQNLGNSRICSNIITSNGKPISEKKKYQSALIDMWKEMSPQKILQNTTFNFKLTNENGTNGYRWCSKINMSFQNKDSNGTMREIIKMVKLNNFKMEISIILENKKQIYFKV